LSCLRGSRATFGLGLSTIMKTIHRWTYCDRPGDRQNKPHNAADFVKLCLGYCLEVYRFALSIALRPAGARALAEITPISISENSIAPSGPGVRDSKISSSPAQGVGLFTGGQLSRKNYL
jgi:hypothetical protein